MGHQDIPLDLRDRMQFASTGRSVVVADREYIDALQSEGALRGCGSVAIMPLESDASIPADTLRGAQVLVLEVDPALESSLQRLSNIRAEHPDLAVIVALRDANVALVRTLIRQGVVDVAQLPFSPDNLATQILDALSSQTEHVRSGHLGALFTVVQATGGCGATTAITHLAEALARTNAGSRGVCLIDLDLQGGDIAAYLGVEPKATVEPLIEAGGRLDAELMRSAVTETRYGFDVLAAPEAIRPIDKIHADHLLAMLRMAQSMYDYVLVDLPPVWTNWSLSVVQAADRIVLVSDKSIAHLRQAKRRLRLFEEIDVPRSRVEVVVGRSERKLFGAIKADDVRDTLGGEMAGSLASEPALLREAQDEGRLLSETHPKSRFVTDIAALATTMAAKAGAR
jgi:pilus assembly protein CpaE